MCWRACLLQSSLSRAHAVVFVRAWIKVVGFEFCAAYASASCSFIQYVIVVKRDAV